MKMVALKYRLHPLALEDALEAENQRPKAESYAGRK
jgi:Mg2+ and Co2+ transporter CorA